MYGLIGILSLGLFLVFYFTNKNNDIDIVEFGDINGDKTIDTLFGFMPNFIEMVFSCRRTD